MSYDQIIINLITIITRATREAIARIKAYILINLPNRFSEGSLGLDKTRLCTNKVTAIMIKVTPTAIKEPI